MAWIAGLWFGPPIHDANQWSAILNTDAGMDLRENQICWDDMVVE